MGAADGPAAACTLPSAVAHPSPLLPPALLRLQVNQSLAEAREEAHREKQLIQSELQAAQTASFDQHELQQMLDEVNKSLSAEREARQAAYLEKALVQIQLEAKYRLAEAMKQEAAAASEALAEARAASQHTAELQRLLEEVRPACVGWAVLPHHAERRSAAALPVLNPRPCFHPRSALPASRPPEAWRLSARRASRRSKRRRWC